MIKHDCISDMVTVYLSGQERRGAEARRDRRIPQTSHPLH